MEREETRLVLLPEDIVAIEALVHEERDESEINDTGIFGGADSWWRIERSNLIPKDRSIFLVE